MPDLNLHPYKKIVTDLPVLNHTIVVDKYELWKHRLNDNKYNPLLLKIKNSYQIKREKLLNYKYSSPEEKCIDIILWGYPRGGRGKNISEVIPKISQIAKIASNKDVSWESYFKSFKGTRVGVATATKFAYFFKIEFDGYRALILDQQIADILNTGVWGKSLSSVGVSQKRWKKSYSRYLAEMSILAERIGCSEDQLELALYLFGKAFR